MPPFCSECKDTGYVPLVSSPHLQYSNTPSRTRPCASCPVGRAQDIANGIAIRDLKGSAPIRFAGREYGSINGYTVTWEYIQNKCMYILKFHGPDPDDVTLNYCIAEAAVKAIPDSTYKDGELRVYAIVRAILSGLLPDLRWPRRVSVRDQVQKRHGLGRESE